MRPDIRIRIRRSIIRIRVKEPCIRAIIRITAEVNTTSRIKQPNIIYALLKKQRRDPIAAAAPEGASCVCE